MSSLVIISVADRGESLWTELALVRFLTCVNSDVYLKVSSLVKLFVTNHILASYGISTDDFGADKVLVLLLLTGLFREILYDRNWKWVFPLLVFLLILATEFDETKVR
jgi:hypothetical protein